MKIRRKFVSYTVIRSDLCYRYLYRQNITKNKDKVFKGKGVVPGVIVNELAQYFYDISTNNTFYPLSEDFTSIKEIIQIKLKELQDKARKNTTKVGLVTYLELFEDVEKQTQIRLVFSEKMLNNKSRYSLWGFDQKEADSIIYLVIHGGFIETEYQEWQVAGTSEIVIE